MGLDGKDHSSSVTISLHLTIIFYFWVGSATVLDASCKVKIMCDDAIFTGGSANSISKKSVLVTFDSMSTTYT
jgi:hypothetical protein